MASKSLTTPFTSWPTDAPSALTEDTGYVRLTGPGNRVEVALKCTAGSGVVYLLRYDDDAAAWLSWGSVAVDNAALGGMALGLFTVDDAAGPWTLFVTGGPTLTIKRFRARTIR